MNGSGSVLQLQPAVRIPMRDGARLATDLYRPLGEQGPLATLLVRTPYDKSRHRTTPHLAARVQRFVEAGYAVAVQDKRGRFESEGQYTLACGDRADGYDTIDWLTRQSWSNGRVGTWGCSYDGETQIYLAKSLHPGLRATIPQAAGGATGSLGGRFTRWGVRCGGAISLAPLIGWMVEHGSKIRNGPPSDVDDITFSRLSSERSALNSPTPIDVQKLWWRLPVVRALDDLDLPANDFVDVVTHDYSDPWWQQFDYLDAGDSVDVPALHVNTWYDPTVAETLDQYGYFRSAALSAGARSGQRVVIGAGTHCSAEAATDRTVVGERPVGDARFDFNGLYRRWFDHWLRDTGPGIADIPAVEYFVLGANQWRSANEWPPAEARERCLYLHSRGHANSLDGDGSLATEPPGHEPPDIICYDPSQPVMSLGGALCVTASPSAEGGSFDQRPIEMRNDVLVYSSERLREKWLVVGEIKVVLFVASSAKDTDITAKLVDVYPDGTAYNVQDGILRLRYREDPCAPRLLQSGRIYRVEIDLQATANLFDIGHKIRLEVSSSNFPRYDRNLNTGGANFDESTGCVARNEVHHSRHYPSSLRCRVLEAS